MWAINCACGLRTDSFGFDNDIEFLCLCGFSHSFKMPNDVSKIAECLLNAESKSEVFKKYPNGPPPPPPPPPPPEVYYFFCKCERSAHYEAHYNACNMTILFEAKCECGKVYAVTLPDRERGRMSRRELYQRLQDQTPTEEP